MFRKDDEWDLIILPKNKWYQLRLKEVWNYRDLMVMFIKRNFISQYRQTVLGPLWHFINPVLTTLVFTVIFGNIAKLSTDGTPKLLFYLSGVTLWNYFSTSLTQISTTFSSNAGIFGKVYFPRIISPLATIISRLIQFGTQLVLLLIFLIYYLLQGSLPNFSWINMLYIPFILVVIAGFTLGFGIIISSLTTKYRDLQILIGFGIQLLMYGTPVVYPLSSLNEKYRTILGFNPLTSLMECFKYIFTGNGIFTFASLMYSLITMLIFLFIGLVVFNRVERKFMDTV